MQKVFIKCGHCKKEFCIGSFPIGIVINVEKGKCSNCDYINYEPFGIITPFSRRIYNLSIDHKHQKIPASDIRKIIYKLNKTEEQENILKELQQNSNPAEFNIVLLATKAWIAQRGIEGGTVSLGPSHSVKFLEAKGSLPAIQHSLVNWYEKRGTVKTKIRFDLFFSIPVPDGEYSICLPDGTVTSLEIRFRPPGYHRMGVIPESTGASIPAPLNSFILEETPADMRVSRVESLSGRALLGFSSILLTLPHFIDTFGDSKLPPSLEKEQAEPVDPLFIYQMPPEFRIVAKYTNLFVDQLRIASGRYEIEKISSGDIETVAISTWGGKFLLMNIPLRGGGPFQISTEPIKRPKWINPFIKELRRNEEPDLIKVLILDAKKFLLQEQLRLAVININAAFEMFVNKHIYHRAVSASELERVNKFMEGESIYEICKKQLIIESEKKNKAYQEVADLIPMLEVNSRDKKKPSVFQIVKFMHKLVPFEISLTQLNRIINNIRIYRNEVAHGVIKDNQIDPYKIGNAINELEKFLEMAVTTTRKLA